MSKLGYKELFYFSLPSILSSLLEPISSVVDTAFIGQLNSEWLASLAVGTSLLNTFTWMFNFLIHVTIQSIADARTQDSVEHFSRKIKVSFICALIVGICGSLILFLVKDYLYDWMNVSKTLSIFVDSYFAPRVLFYFMSLLFVTLISMLRGIEKVREAFFLVFITTLINIFLTFLFLNVF